MTSSQVSWWDVHEYVEPVLESVENWPMAGTVAWCALDDADPRKLAAIYDAAQHWALRVETSQEAMCEASQAISAAVDWPRIATRLTESRDASYIPRKVSS